MLKLENITRVYTDDDGRSVRALDGLSLVIKRGELKVLMGPNGSGKSTAFRIIAHQERPDEGRLVWEMPANGRLNDSRQHRVTHVPQDPKILSFPGRTLEENLLWTEMNGRRSRFWARGITRARRSRYRSLMERYEVTPLVEALPRPLGTLSGGWQQVFVILAAVAGREDGGPELLLLDEPTASLDVRNTRLCLDLIRRLHREGRTIVVATHDASVAADIAQNLAILSKGKLLTELSRQEIINAGVEGVARLLAREEGLGSTHAGGSRASFEAEGDK